MTSGLHAIHGRALSEHQAEKLLEGVSTVINSILNTQSGAGTSASSGSVQQQVQPEG